jgi:hypothetical protein
LYFLEINLYFSAQYLQTSRKTVQKEPFSLNHLKLLSHDLANYPEKVNNIAGEMLGTGHCSFSHTCKYIWSLITSVLITIDGRFMALGLLNLHIGLSGVHALPLAAGINVGGHYKWHFFLSLLSLLWAHC